MREKASFACICFLHWNQKVNHKIWPKKMMKQNNVGKLGRRITLSQRFKFVTNRTMPYEDILSGIPQGMILASLFFIMMLSDNNRETLQSIVRCFTKDIRVSRKMISDKQRCKKLMVYWWAKVKLMEFIQDKFEEISHGIHNYTLMTQ